MELNNRFYIVNCCDQPYARHIAQKGRDGLLHYIHPTLRDKYRGMSMNEATPVEDFGIELSLCSCGRELRGERMGESKAVYRDGRKRLWQGQDKFSVELLNKDGE